MASYRANAYQYDTSPRKLRPEYEPQRNPYIKKKSSTLKKNKKVQNVKSKPQLKAQVKTVAKILVIFGILLAISYRNSLINESFTRKEQLQAQLGVTQKENEQLQVNIENSLNLSNIEKLAKEKLGMQKLDNTQKVYINLPKKDYVEPAVEEVIIEEELNWFKKLINMFTGK